MFTKQELKDAICEAFGYNPETDGTKNAFIDKKKAELQANYANQIALIEKPSAYLKRIGLERLLEKERVLNETLEL